MYFVMVCMYVCIFVYACEYMYDMCVCMYVYICLYACMHVCVGGVFRE